MKADRLAIILEEEPGHLSLVGFHPTDNPELADLKNGYPCDGLWLMDYVDQVGNDANAHVYARDTADALWGTIYSDTGEVVRDDLLEWHEDTLSGMPVVAWAVRSEDDYVQGCLDSLDTTSLG